ncbi:MAG: bifunctional diaminohydroxyphosphoribosylaminopyrimidine deaminase/5-amino-6-(5-phosphoribosylamino)uracil reductase RibD [Planctomycetota bacterium]|nr:bifunctional diaminohydroxyphosphoribosylaminopyrimidine deaminase/5-amino-6-(5-phosphoribosylamino)uracil reductase RibD [Planctomycetota bacterium]MDW8373353.1 bifunctional diaminohydroxyphosphoribosylaminopyrimidine deaminase/5-amino-6-(5-phosphoribosylamino)uracil reductase RibD [Planctomycetota bacterium]
MPDDAAWMARALRLAARSLGCTWPNPGVGCVIVRDGQLLAEARHERCGDLHAETAALARCAQARAATVYVTLAPCTRPGRQPPCVDALIRAGVARVVAAIADPMQDDPGPRLAAAGIAYEVGCLEALARHVHGGFLARVTRGRPRVTGKWARSADGCLSAGPGQRTAISCPLAYALMRRRRRAFDAILVGAGTALVDDPWLTAPRPRWHGEVPGPLRLVVSRHARAALRNAAAPWLAIHAPGAGSGLAVADPHDPAQVLHALGAYGINELLVEGGATVHRAWLPFYDRIELYVGPEALGQGLAAPPDPQPPLWQLEQPPRIVGRTLVARWTRRG